MARRPYGPLDRVIFQAMKETPMDDKAENESTQTDPLVTADSEAFLPDHRAARRVFRPLSMTSRIIGGIGRSLITAGVLILLFVVYQLWGTGIREAASQDQLKTEFAVIEKTVPTEPSPTVPTTSPNASTTAAGSGSSTTATAQATTTAPETAASGSADPSAPPKTGAAIAHIVIPKIGVDKYIVQGVSVDDLKRAPGHYANTVFPGQIGNSGIAGHRTTYGAPFNRLDELANGDEIKITTLQGTFTYIVDGQKVVDPSDVSVLDNTPTEARLTLTTCNPKYSAATRLIIMAKLQDKPVTPIPATSIQNQALPTTNNGNDALGNEGTAQTIGTTTPSATPGTAAPGTAAVAQPISFEGTSTNIENKSVVKAIFVGSHTLWALLCAAIWFLAWFVGRKMRTSRKWLTYAVALVPFLFVLFFFFEGVGNNLPPGV